VIIDVFCRHFAQLTQRSPITPADSVHCCHGDHRCILQTLCPVGTAITDHSCRLCTLLPRWSSMYSADTLPGWHGGHRCLLQFFFLPQQFTGVSRRTFTSLPWLL
jgi:hypothetical protein